MSIDRGPTHLRERCVVCDRFIDFDEPISISETGVGAVCQHCSVIIDSVYDEAKGATPLSKQEADALAAAWMSGQVAPEDFDSRIREWQSEASVRQAVKEGDLHQKQVTDEIRRRQGAGRGNKETKAFVDKHPLKFQKRERRGES